MVGSFHNVERTGDHSTNMVGGFNYVERTGDHSTNIVGGFNNVERTGDHSTIMVGGYYNVERTGDHSTYMVGGFNNVERTGDHSTYMVGGFNNVERTGDHSTYMVGGFNNVERTGDHSTYMVGGFNNVERTDDHSTIMVGGYYNVERTGDHSNNMLSVPPLIVIVVVFTKSYTMPLFSSFPRWNCWYGAVKYQLQHLEYLKGFTAEEGNHCGRMAPDSLKLIQDMLTCAVELLTLKAEMSSMVQHSMNSVSATEIKRYRESLGPEAVKVSGKIPISLTVFWNSMPIQVRGFNNMERIGDHSTNMVRGFNNMERIGDHSTNMVRGFNNMERIGDHSTNMVLRSPRPGIQVVGNQRWDPEAGRRVREGHTIIERITETMDGKTMKDNEKIEAISMNSRISHLVSSSCTPNCTTQGIFDDNFTLTHTNFSLERTHQRCPPCPPIMKYSLCKTYTVLYLLTHLHFN
ncbi:hypothetical protein RRG08_014717 [Elysia crispata]|uniref:Uncharacterized protein n=1 Tax=Elysia crispata TaxID=231223 RepID=A0AAE1ASQ7_9GAST|nr:hypothetical protein RRG08_014717 [Elysia crispata]